MSAFDDDDEDETGWQVVYNKHRRRLLRVFEEINTGVYLAFEPGPKPKGETYFCRGVVNMGRNGDYDFVFARCNGSDDYSSEGQCLIHDDFEKLYTFRKTINEYKTRTVDFESNDPLLRKVFTKTGVSLDKMDTTGNEVDYFT